MNKKHILVIEDDTSLSTLLMEHLIAAGFEVEVAADGEKGLQAAEKKPDLIMLDILMPKLDGIAVMKTLRENSDWGAHVPIIIISNLNPNDDKVINSVANYSPIFYLIKAEHSLNDIVDKVKEILKFK